MSKEITSEDIAELCEKTVKLKPAFAERNVAVAVFSSLEYLPMAAIVFQSIIEHANPQRNYDLILVCPNLPLEEDRERLFSMVKKYRNFSLRIVDGFPFTELLHKGLEQKYFPSQYNIDGECLRLFVPLVCQNYEKIVCLGADVAVTTDVAQLYDVELGEHPIAAPFLDSALMDMHSRISKVLFERANPNPQEWEYEDVNSWKMPRDFYYKKVAGITTSNAFFFNADVLLLNVSMLNAEKFTQRGLNSLFCKRWRSISEGVYNHLLHSRCLWLPSEWNVYSSIWPGLLDSDLTATISEPEMRAYSKLVKNAKIFHFIGQPYKPWNNPSAPHAEVWWGYARETPFYEQLLSMTFETTYKAYAKKIFTEWRKIPSLKRKMRFLRVVRQFTFGNTRRRLKEREKALKTRIREFRAMIR